MKFFSVVTIVGVGLLISILVFAFPSSYNTTPLATAQSCAGDGEVVQEDDGDETYEPLQQYVADDRCCSGTAVTGGAVYKDSVVCYGNFTGLQCDDWQGGIMSEEGSLRPADGNVVAAASLLFGLDCQSFCELQDPTYDNACQSVYKTPASRYCFFHEGVTGFEQGSFPEGHDYSGGGAWPCFGMPCSSSAYSSVTFCEYTPQYELGAGTPTLSSGELIAEEALVFSSSITNSGLSDIVGSFDVRFQIDVGNDGVYDTNIDTLDAVTGLSSGNSEDVLSDSWTAIEGTHAVRACADLPGDDISETNESNNCSGDYVFTVVTNIQCADGIDNNGNGLIDHPADPACTSPNDATEQSIQCSDGIDNDGDGDIDLLDTGCSGSTDTDESDDPECSDGIDNDGDDDIDYPDDLGCENVNDNNEGSAPQINMSFEADPDLVRFGNTSDLSWSVTSAKVGSCTISGTNGDYFTLSGQNGTQTSGLIYSITIFTLTCEDLEGSLQATSTTVRVVPVYQEI